MAPPTTEPVVGDARDEVRPEDTSVADRKPHTHSPANSTPAVPDLGNLKETQPGFAEDDPGDLNCSGTVCRQPNPSAAERVQSIGMELNGETSSDPASKIGWLASSVESESSQHGDFNQIC